MNKISLLIYLYIFNINKAFCSLYRNWISIAKSNFKKGKETYRSLLNNIQENEQDCISLVSIDKHISNNFPVDLDYVENSKDPYPCLTQISKIGDQFDIDSEQYSTKDLSYNKILSEAGCWKFVLNELHSIDIERCDFKGEASRSLIALAKTKCHFLRANRKFPSKIEGCVLNPGSLSIDELNSLLNINKDNKITEEFLEYDVNPCSLDYRSSQCEKVKRRIVSQCTDTNVMSEAAFQMYHSDLNHIDNICFYLQSGEWNRRNELNINKLTDSAHYMIDVYRNVKEQFEVLNSQQNEQLNKAENLTIWIDSIKSDLGDVIRIITIVKEYQRKILEFISNFKTYCAYLVFIIMGVIITSFEFASGSRLKVLTAITFCCFIETLVNKVFTGWLDIDISRFASPEDQKHITKWIRIIMAGYVIIEWIYSFITYKPEWKIMLKEVNEIKKTIENPVIYVYGNGMIKSKEVRYTLDDFVEKYGDDDSEFTYDSDDDGSEYDSENSSGCDSSDLEGECYDILMDEKLNKTYTRFNSTDTL